MITPVEVLGKELKRGFGYKAVEVDEFLEDLAKDYEKIYKENNELREKVSALTENLDHYRTIEESLKRALVLAEETSKETIENATQKAQTMEAEASRNAKELVAQAQAEADKIVTSAKDDFREEKEKHEEMISNYQKLLHKLESDYQSYKARMKQFINGQLDILNNPVYEIEFQIAGEQSEEEQDKDHEQFGKEQ
jgi:cell division initiation protein